MKNSPHEMQTSENSRHPEFVKIGFDAKRAFFNRTGLGNYSRTLLHFLSENSLEFSFVLYVPELPTENTNLFSTEVFPVRTPTNRIRKLFWRRFQILKDLKKDQIRLFHGLSNELPAGISRTKIKSVVSVHDLIFRTHPETYSWIERFIYHLKMVQAIRESDRILAMSLKTKKDLCKYYGVNSEKIEVVYQACNPIFYENTPKDRDNFLSAMNLPNEYLLYVGTIEERKNLLRIVQAVLQLPKDQKIPLVILGRGKKYKQKVQKFIAKQGAEQYFIWLAEISDTLHLKKLYENAKIFIYPSLYEGFGIPVLEAMLSGTAILTSPDSSMAEIAEEYAFYADPCRIDELVLRLREILSNPELIKIKAQQAREHANRKFHPGVIAKQVIQVYKQILC